MKKAITITNNQNKIRVSGNIDTLKVFLTWIKTHNRGTLQSQSIVCTSPNDLVACRQKAKEFNLTVSE